MKKITSQIDVLLAEFTALKAEESVAEQAQTTIATATFSFISAILGISFIFDRSSEENVAFIEEIPQFLLEKQQAAQYIVLIFCPMLIMFFGCLWMREVYSQMRFGAYIYHLESDINYFLEDPHQYMYFEHWIIEQEKPAAEMQKKVFDTRKSNIATCCSNKFFLPMKSFFGHTSRFYGYVTFGTWIFAPALLYMLAYGMFPQWDIILFMKNVWPATVLLIIIFMVYILIQVKTCSTILSLKNSTNLNKNRVPAFSSIIQHKTYSCKKRGKRRIYTLKR